MGLENANTLAGLVATNPLGSDQVKFGDDHIRLLKSVLKSDLAWLWSKNRVYSFQAGAVVTTNDVLWDAGSGLFYHWDGEYSGEVYTVLAGSTPATAGGVGPAKWVSEGAATFKELLAKPNGYIYIGGVASQGDIERLETQISALTQDTTAQRLALANILVFGLDSLRNNIVLIGDSITVGVGSPVAHFAYASLLGQALANYYPAGYRYPIHRNPDLAEKQYSTNGAKTGQGLAQEAITLTPGQTITFKQTEAIGVIGIILGTVSGNGASVALQINGTTVASLNVNSSQVQQELFLTIPAGRYITSADVMRVVAVGGSVVISGIAPAKFANAAHVGGSSLSPLVITCGASAQSFEYYRSNKELLAQMSTMFSASNSESTYILALGTNSIYNSGLAQTPAEYVTSMMGLAADLAALNPFIRPVFTIPPQATSAWPVIKTEYTYQDYRDAILAATATHDLIDLNLVKLSYSDGVHPSAIGHIALASHYCDRIGIPANFEPPMVKQANRLVGNSPVLIDNGYVTMDSSGLKTLSGLVSPNGAGTNLIVTLAPDFWPRADRYCPIALLGAAGLGIIHISASNGEIRLFYNAVAWSSAYLDGVTFL
jgi:lysophospholipase L1-like esterase